MRSFARPILLFFLFCGAYSLFPRATAAGDLPTVPPIHRPALKAQARALVDDGARDRQQLRFSGVQAPDRLNVLLMMCDFADSLLLGRHGQVPGDFPPPAQTGLYYAAHDSTYFHHLMDQVRAYYADVSGGALTVDFTIHPRVVNLPEAMGFYGDHPENGEQPVVLADRVVRALDDEVDFSAFDTFVLAHAGAGEETDVLGSNPEQIFSTYLDPTDFTEAFEDGAIELPFIPAGDFPDSNGIDRVLVLPECHHQAPIGYFGSLGVYCFEFGLHLGMLSLSDFTPAGRPDSQGIGQVGLMGFGLFTGLGFIPPQPVAFNRLLMGWLDPYPLDPALDDGGRLTPAGDPANRLACARVDITGQEYWLLSYRLQDPDGNRIFSFPDDKNGNNIPDFWDADSPTGDGVPEFGAKFDAATDSIETLPGAEWDFFMTEWVDTDSGATIRGRGSGVYVWHVDEGVVQAVFGSDSNLFNADPRRKSVDLEEADRIQDLDSNQGSPFMLGWDGDAFRGEGATEFGPRTLPATDTAGGAFTGVAFGNFSPVVADSTAFPLFVAGPDTFWGLAYADTMTFSLTREPDGESAPVLTRNFAPGTDLRGSHLLVTHLDGPDASGQVVLAANAGRVFVLDGALDDYLPGGDPTVLEPFAVGLRAGEPVRWNLPAAAGDLDGDGRPDIVLATAGGLYAFAADGSALGGGSAADFGLYAALDDCALPPVLGGWSTGGGDPGVSDGPVALVVDRAGGMTRLRFFEGTAGTEIGNYDLGEVDVPAPPVQIGDFVAVAFADTVAGEQGVLVFTPFRVAIPENPGSLILPLSIVPGPWAPAWGIVPGSPVDDPTWYVTVTDAEGRAETVVFRDGAGPVAVGKAQPWPADPAVLSPLAPGGAFVTEGAYGRRSHAGDWVTGWPRRPLSPVAASPVETAATPLAASLVGQQKPRSDFLFTGRDGRIYAFANDGEALPAWPVAGPGRSAGSPALGDLGGDALLDLVAIGTFDRINGVEGGGTDLATETVATIALWNDVALTDAAWPMWGGGPWRNGWSSGGDSVAPPAVAEGTGLVPGSHMVYPSPLLGPILKVRGTLRAPGRVRVFVYNLEGEEVTASGWRQVPAVAPFDVEVDLARAVSGMYLCRLLVESGGAEADQSVVPFAVVR